MSVTTTPFGTVPGIGAASLFTLRLKSGATLTLTDLGATWVGWSVPDRDGRFADIVQGFDDAAGYARQTGSFGATCGRVINRIAGGKFRLDGKDYSLAVNNGPNHLHGGPAGFSRRLWKAEIGGTPEAPAVAFSRRSADGEEGYPGNLDITVTYTFESDASVRIDYRATTDAATPVNIANHAYFNLGGHDHDTILDHTLKIFGKHYLPADENSIPTGEIVPVAGTPLDFREPRLIGERIGDSHDQLRFGRGYDQSFVVGGTPGELRPAAELSHPKSGRILLVETTEPDIHLYSGNWNVECVNGAPGKGGATYGFRSSVCLEAQKFPDAVNQPAFPTIVLRPGETYRTTTVHRLRLAKA